MYLNSEISPLRQAPAQVAIQNTQEVVPDGPVITPDAEVPTLTPDISTQLATQPPVNPRLVTTLQDVKKAVVQIEAQGTFIDPQIGLVVNGAGRGSGFIIDPSGIAVTNNHVVTGAALLKVWVHGESTPRNAKILGVSECSDLAVIDIDGEGYDFLDWQSVPIAVGMDVYVAGYPLGDAEYTLNKGIISKAEVSGETNWASVDSVVEYDATSNPGNSGGPVVSEEGKVLAVHYAGDASTRQAFGISKDIASGIIAELSSGSNRNSIGINGQAVTSADSSLTGVWVASVQSGSPADEAGVKAGDLITRLENLVLASDGTLSSYCDILRSHKPEDTLAVEVVRWASGEILAGQLNGRDLQVTSVLTNLDSNTNTNDQTSASTDIVNPAASQTGDYYYYTEFDGSLDSWEQIMILGDEQDVTAKTENSRVRVEIDNTDTYAYFVYTDYDYSDVRIETLAENLGRNNNNVSLICRASDQGWYEFNIANNGKYWFYWYDIDTGRGYVQLWEGGSTAIKMGANTNEYIAICQGAELTLYINGVKVKSVTDITLKSGKVGLSVSSFNVTPIIIEFDYFAVTVP
ncbi:MAG: serine protease [Anaerolineales bacterium]|nr:MAG: serine protease [Anaerolineales bacterium]